MALEDFRACFSVLQELRRTWSSADLIAAIAKKVLDELEGLTDLRLCGSKGRLKLGERAVDVALPRLADRKLSSTVSIRGMPLMQA